MTNNSQTTFRSKSKLHRAPATLVGLFVLVAFVVVSASVWLYALQLQNTKDHVERRLDHVVDTLGEALITGDRVSLERVVSVYGADSEIEKIVVLDAQARKMSEIDYGARRASRDGLAFALTPEAVYSFSVERALTARSSTVGTVRVAYKAESLAVSFVSLVSASLLTLSATLLLIWRIHIRMHRAVILPMEAIEHVSDQITRTGDMSHRMPQLASNDGQRLEETVNRLLDQLDQQEKKKAIYRASLEREVEKRTKALAGSNERLQKLAYISAETSLPNRAAFLDRLHKLCVTPHVSDLVLGVFVIRIVRVPYANEAFGFDVGDLMIESAGRILSALRTPESELFHLGGSEFAVIRSDDADSMQDVANELLRVDEVPFVYRGATLTMQPRIGYAIFPKDATNVDDLTRFAMLALNVATAPGSRSDSIAYDPKLLKDAMMLELIESAIKRAVDTGQFEPHFQSRVDTETGRVHGLEALIRWTSPDLSEFTNYQLIPIAERSLLATELDSQMLRRVVEWLAPLAKDGIRIPVAVNLSSRSLQRAALPDEIRALVHLHDVDIKQIEIELTETVLKEKNDVVSRNISSLHEMGARLLLADFGNGYSSLRFLQELPIAIVKIDRAFVNGLPDDTSSLAIMESTIKLVHRLGKRVVAEGVETYGQWEALRSLGCDEVQGYFLMRPQGPEVVANMLRQQFDTSVGHLTIDLTSVEKKEGLVFPTFVQTE